MKALITTFIIIAAAELGDKTQLLTFGFATRYPLWEVLAAVSCATGILMAAAVLFGGVIHYYIPAFYISLLAGSLFVLFGIWNLFGEKEEETEGKTKGAPFWIVFTGFLLAELGDKTQLATLALAAELGSPWLVWAGATLAMVLVNGIGALTGKWIGKLIPEFWLRLFGSAIFIIFGIVTLFELIAK